MKLKRKVAIILGICMFSGSSITVKANENKVMNQEVKLINENKVMKTVGPMNLPAIDPVLNPAEDNIMSRIIAEIVLGDKNRYTELTQDDFNEVNYIRLYHDGVGTFHVPKQIGNLVNLESIVFYANNDSWMMNTILKIAFLGSKVSLPEEMNNLVNLRDLTIKGFECSEKDVEEFKKLPNLMNISIYDYGKLTSINNDKSVLNNDVRDKMKMD